jgi:hypothetical protein
LTIVARVRRARVDARARGEGDVRSRGFIDASRFARASIDRATGTRGRRAGT